MFSNGQYQCTFHNPDCHPVGHYFPKEHSLIKKHKLTTTSIYLRTADAEQVGSTFEPIVPLSIRWQQLRQLIGRAPVLSKQSFPAVGRKPTSYITTFIYHWTHNKQTNWVDELFTYNTMF